MSAGFRIENTEVTRSHYHAWLQSGPSLGDQPPYCAANLSFQPVCEWPPNSGEADLPVVCVDWCDARAYCLAQGRRLCGKINGGSLSFSDFAQADKSEWHYACTNDATTAYCYGNSYDPTVCNGAGLGAGTTVPVSSLPGCQAALSPFGEVFDLNGNAVEWEDACEDDIDEDDMCRLRGGGYESNANLTLCSGSRAATRLWKSPDVGFRCCAD